MPDKPLPPGVIAADGTGTISWRPDSRQNWSVSQVTTRASGVGSGAVCELRKSGNRITLMIPTGDTAGGDPPVGQSSSETMDVHWTGATAGAAIEVTTIIYDIVG